MSKIQYGIYVPTPGTSMGSYFYFKQGEKLETVQQRERACCFASQEECQQACDDLNRWMMRPVGTTDHPSCYVVEVR